MTTPFKRWHLQQLDLRGAPDVLEPVPGTAGTYVVMWRSGIPLGEAYLPRDLLPVSASHLAAIAAKAVAPAVSAHLSDRNAETPFLNAAAVESPFDRLEKRLANDPVQEGLTVSVVVCTRDRTEALQRCLRSLRDLRPQPEEIIVVDNAPKPSVRGLAAAAPGVCYVHEPSPGLDVARNAGARAAAGAVVAYADDDVEVHPGWIRGIRRGFASREVAGITGLVLPAELETEAQFLFEQHWRFGRGYRPVLYDADYFARYRNVGAPVWEIGAGANMAFRREVFDVVGGFDERLDVGAAGCNGDSEFWYRMLAAGMTLRYEPTAVAFHHHRRELPDMQRQLYSYMRGHACALLVQNERNRGAGNIRRLSLGLPLHFGRTTATGLMSSFEGRHQFLRSEIKGYLSGIGYYFRNRQRTGAPAMSRTEVAEEAV